MLEASLAVSKLMLVESGLILIMLIRHQLAAQPQARVILMLAPEFYCNCRLLELSEVFLLNILTYTVVHNIRYLPS